MQAIAKELRDEKTRLKGFTLALLAIRKQLRVGKNTWATHNAVKGFIRNSVKQISEIRDVQLPKVLASVRNDFVIE
jgi:hypothetical protein